MLRLWLVHGKVCISDSANFIPHKHTILRRTIVESDSATVQGLGEEHMLQFHVISQGFPGSSIPPRKAKIRP